MRGAARDLDDGASRQPPDRDGVRLLRADNLTAVRSGSWRFAPLLGNASFAAPTFDDSSWANVTTPSDWHSYGVKKYNATGWFRKRIVVTPSQLDAVLALPAVRREGAIWHALRRDHGLDACSGFGCWRADGTVDRGRRPPS